MTVLILNNAIIYICCMYFRINILFASCGQLFLHRERWGNFADKFTDREIATKIEKDLNNADIMFLVQCVGLVGKMVTGPWMSLFYGNKDSKCILVGRRQGSSDFAFLTFNMHNYCACIFWYFYELYLVH